MIDIETAVASVVSEIVVTDFAVGQPNDYTDAIVEALKHVPPLAAEAVCDPPELVEHSGCILRFPAKKGGYRITRTIVLPAGVSVALMGTGPFGVSIILDQDPDDALPPGVPYGYAFLVPKPNPGEGAQASLLVERLTLIDGGIAFEGDRRGWSSIRDCVFRGAPDWAVAVLSNDVTNLEIDGCTVASCAKGFSLAAPHSGIRRVRGTRFHDNSGTDLRVGSGDHVSACTFEGKPEDVPQAAFVEVASGSRGVRIRDCSFGSALGAPATLIGIGGSPGGPLSGVPVRDIQIVACQLWIREPDGEDVAAKPCAVRLRAPTIGVQIRGCNVWSGGLIVSEDYYGTALAAAGQLVAGNPLTLPTQLMFDNVVSNVVIFPPALPALFDCGGRGFEVSGESGIRAAGRGDDPSRGTVNLLREVASADPSAAPWFCHGSAMPLSVVEDADSPLGLAYRVVRNGPGLAWVEQAVAYDALSPFDAEPLVFSCWIRGESSGDLNLTSTAFRLEVSFGGLSVGGSPKRPIRLSGSWERHHVTAFRLPTVPFGDERVLTVRVYVGEADTEVLGSLRFCGAQLEPGDRPTGLIVNGVGVATPALSNAPTATVGGGLYPGQPISASKAILDVPLHAARAMQEVSVGLLVIGSAVAAPATAEGYNPGDALLNSSPSADSKVVDFDGWVCVEQVAADGSVNKAWKAYGPLGPLVPIP